VSGLLLDCVYRVHASGQSCRTHTLKQSVNQMQNAAPSSCCCSHQSRALPFYCLYYGSPWTFRAHFVVDLSLSNVFS